MINPKNVLLALSAIALSSTMSFGLLAEEDKPVNKGDRPGHVMKDVVPKDQVPPSPILSVQEAIESMVLQDGFVLENVVSEPNVFNPVTMVFDGNGRMWVCEMTRFMPDTFGTGEHVPEGNIAVLEDTDGDGKVDKRTVFLNDIVLPRTISLVKGGIFYADHTQLYFTEVIEQDGKITPGLREVVDPTYAAEGNLEHKTNTMLYGIDNWYYNAKSDKKYQTLAHNAPIPKGAKEIYRNKYWKLVRGRSDYRGQWGLSMDDYGRLFNNNNWEPAHGEFLMPGALLKNPGFHVKTRMDPIGDFNVFPARMNTGVNRGYLDGVLIKEGEHQGKLRNFTAASGSVIYRGDNFPAKFYGMAVTPEPAGNLITARQIIEKAGQLSGEAIYPQHEILASTDERFRPVNLYTAPDGSLYILDMYHGILQHKEFLTTYLSDQIKARELDKNNNTMGRIYRLRWQGNKLGPQPTLNDMSAQQLVPFLAHDNGWWRDTARRLLIEKADKSVVPSIQEMTTKLPDAKKVVNGIWTLYGLNAIDYETVSKLLINNDKKIVAAAITVSPQVHKKHHAKLAETYLSLAQQSYHHAIYIALVAGELESPKALAASKVALDNFINMPQMREAVVSGLGDKTDAFLKLVNGHYPDPNLMYYLDNLGKRPQDKTSREQLSAIGKTLYDEGKALYNGRAACFGCHGVDGNGMKGMGPTFWGSEWVVKDPKLLAKVMLHGLMGDIWINGYLWQTPMVMPGMAERTDMTDRDLAAISTYIRNTWGNSADIDGQVSPELYKQVRKATQGRKKPYTQKDIFE